MCHWARSKKHLHARNWCWLVTTFLFCLYFTPLVRAELEGILFISTSQWGRFQYSPVYQHSPGTKTLVWVSTWAHAASPQEEQLTWTRHALTCIVLYVCNQNKSQQARESGVPCCKEQPRWRVSMVLLSIYRHASAAITFLLGVPSKTPSSIWCYGHLRATGIINVN